MEASVLSETELMNFVKNVYEKMEKLSSAQEEQNFYKNIELDTEYLREYCCRHRRLLTAIFGWSALLIAGQEPDISILETIQRNVKGLVSLIEELEQKLEERQQIL